MKILILNNLYPPNGVGGAERSVQFIAEGLLSLGDLPVVVTSDATAHRNVVNGVRVHYLKTANLYPVQGARRQPLFKKPLWHAIDTYNPTMARAVGAVIDEEHPDILLTNNLSGFSCRVWTEAHSRQIPIIHTIRDQYLLCLKSTMFKRGANCTRQCLLCSLAGGVKRRQSRHVSAVVGVSRYILEKHKRFGYFADTPVAAVIRNVAGSPAADTNDRTTAGASLLRIGIIGALVEGKGIEQALSIFRDLNLPSTELHIFGKGQTPEYEERLVAQYRSPAITFHGFASPDTLYDSLDLVLIPSLWDEAFPRVFIEAVHHGKPVIVSNRGGSAEMVQPGVNGWIYDPDIVGDLESRLTDVAANRHLLPKMTAACLATAAEFSQERICGQYHELISNVLTMGAANAPV